MTPWRDRRRPQPALSRGSVKRVLADAEDACGHFRTDQVGALALEGEGDRQSLYLAWVEPAVSAPGDDGRQNAVVDGADNRGPADAKTLCCRV